MKNLKLKRKKKTIAKRTGSLKNKTNENANAFYHKNIFIRKIQHYWNFISTFYERVVSLVKVHFGDKTPAFEHKPTG